MVISKPWTQPFLRGLLKEPPFGNFRCLLFRYSQSIARNSKGEIVTFSHDVGPRMISRFSFGSVGWMDRS